MSSVAPRPSCSIVCAFLHGTISVECSGAARKYRTTPGRDHPALRDGDGRPMSDITRILDRLQQGDAQAAAELLPLVYGELRKLAAAKMAQERPGQTLQATALVHEAWLRLGGSEAPSFQNRAHFFGA